MKTVRTSRVTIYPAQGGSLLPYLAPQGESTGHLSPGAGIGVRSAGAGRPFTGVSAAVDQERTHAIVALLHDILEDNNDTDLSAYPKQVQEAVHTITRQAGETYDASIERVAQNPLARTVKLADLRLNHATAPEERLRERYARALTRLEQEEATA